ncbi:uncharacterized protein LOC112083913 [Eutrema salsugineum]|uniref:uncharacterized protein LOC112083913 n=1 Tax=Eutrema salsugineum TaxID=72664 RepID=UPI000CED3AD6|nr:uncharacterized protein LOC112083913 [Eutrema salsugineum]
MYNGLLCLLTLSFLLFSGLSNTAMARVQYESPKPREWVWDQKVIREIKIEVGGSCSPQGKKGRSPKKQGSRERCPKP